MCLLCVSLSSDGIIYFKQGAIWGKILSPDGVFDKEILPSSHTGSHIPNQVGRNFSESASQKSVTPTILLSHTCEAISSQLDRPLHDILPWKSLPRRQRWKSKWTVGVRRTPYFWCTYSSPRTSPGTPAARPP
jgi:hypothetical protein